MGTPPVVDELAGSSLSPAQSYTKALEYILKSAEKGSAEGQYYMGYMHLRKFSEHGLPLYHVQ